MPKVSVVIPCYNQGLYLDDAVDSVLSQTFRDFEIIIVNDGSTDEATNLLLSNFRKPMSRVIHTPNQGLAMARNRGIGEATGEYILPLDADDTIAPTYLERAVRAMETGPDLGIVYCKAETFGAVTGPWFAAEYSDRGMLIGNLIFCSALYRKADWQAVGGYRANMAHGWEDWDFWLSIVELGRTVHRIPEVLFHYRVKEISMAKSLDTAKRVEMHLQVMRNHKDLYIENARPLLELFYRVSASRPYRLLKWLGVPRMVASLFGGGK